MSIILTGSAYRALPRQPETFVIDALLPLGGALLLYGNPKVGKSFAALQLATAISKGENFLGFPTLTPGRVAYIQLDTPRSLWADRLDELAQVGVDLEGVGFADCDLLGTFPFDILKEEHFQVLSLALQAFQPVAVVIDTLKEAHHADENDATEMQKVISRLTAAVQPAALILIHHNRKQGEIPDDILNGSRGSSYLIGKMDGIIFMRDKSISYVGRAIEEGYLKTDRMDNGFWSVANDETNHIIQEVVQNGGSDRELARMLASRINKKEEACRSLIRRWKRQQKHALRKGGHLKKPIKVNDPPNLSEIGP